MDSKYIAPEFKTLLLGVRPARTAVLLNCADDDWQNTCIRLLEFFTAVWGGKHSLIIPTDGTTIKKVFWELLEAFDPDYIYAYQKTLNDLKLVKPDKYAALLDREVSRASAGENPANTHLIKHIDEVLSGARTDKFEIASNLQNELRSRLAPLYFMEHTVQPGFLSAGADAHYPLSTVNKLLPNCDHASNVSIIVSNVPDVPPLWYNSFTGCISGPYSEELKKCEIGISQTEYGAESVGDLIELGVLQNHNGAFPFDLSMAKLGYYASIKLQHWREPSVVVVGSSLEDFCLYHNLSKLRHRVSWFLPSWQISFDAGHQRAKNGGESLSPKEMHAFYFAHALLKTRKPSQEENRFAFVSTSLNKSQLQSLRAGLDEALLMGGNIIEHNSDVLDSIEGLLKFPLSVYEFNNTNNAKTQQFTNSEMAGPLDTPKPKNFTKIDPYEHRWMTEIMPQGHHIPRHSLLGELVIRDHRLSTHEVRAGLKGVSFFCPNVAIFSQNIDDVLVKPSIYLPDTLECVSHIAKSTQLSCKVSDKGYFLLESIRKMGGLSEFANFLRETKSRNLLDKFLDETKVDAGVRDEGVFLKSDRRRYLDLLSICKVMSVSDVEAGQIVDRLVEAGVLYRGFVFKCAFCRNADWFSVADVDQEFECKRCNQIQKYEAQHLLGRIEPTWFYKLDEIVYQGHRNNMIVPVLTLNALSRRKDQSFLYTSELEFIDLATKSPLMEIDICCTLDGILCIGEAKKNDCLGENSVEDEKVARSYLGLANRLGARNAVFATLMNDWSDRTRAKLKTVFDNTSVTLTLLHGRDLFS